MTLRSMTLLTATIAAAAFALPAMAENPETTRNAGSAQSVGITYGPYLKLDLGVTSPDIGSASWLPHGYPDDPKVFFDLDGDETYYGSLAVGYDWMNGFRGEFSFSEFGMTDVAGDWSRTVPETPGPHASMDTRVSATAIMANGYYAPVQFSGNFAKFQPFLTAGIGIARNEMETWTRTNPDADGQETRTFADMADTTFAWNAGLGVAAEFKTKNGHPIMVEASYRYFDLGTAIGGRDPLPGEGESVPVGALKFENRAQVFSLGVRIPLRRY